ncbi:winged helix-turn-helix domain-containing protein [Rhizobium johnstonii]|uniref:winged helix-turn-helix domain-containing protein n=1 Tax=Rhizobium TaxID=379 RepID=UPI00140FAD25|nr:winged helix-turn-helix domain-containing protein [Rhizobium leguminosarum]QIO64021.1 hypothetical protein HA462_02675 [Rhizobium leguminosarum bv. trifolii]
METGFAFAQYRLFPASRTFVRDDTPVTLGSRAFDILGALVQNAGEVVSHRELIAFAWNGLNVDESNVRVQMAKLRKVLAEGSDDGRFIASVAGRGYVFVAPVELVVREGGVEKPQDSEINLRKLSEPIVKPDRPRSIAPATQAGRPQSVVGREDNIADLLALLERNRVVTIFGPGGIGKSTLASLLVERIDPSSRKVIFIDLAETDPSQVRRAVNAASGHEASEHAPPGQLDVLLGVHPFVVLDNCDHVTDEVAGISAQIVGEIGDANVIITSRDAAAGEQGAIYPLRPLAQPPFDRSLTAEQALQWPAIALFMERAGEGGFRGTLSDDKVMEVAALCRKLDGNPLAIELVAGRAGAYGLDCLPQLLTDHLALRWRGMRNAAPRHRSAEAMLDCSYNLLNAKEQKVLQRLSVFVEQFSYDAAVAVASGQDLGEGEITDCINSLIAKSLVTFNASARPNQLQLSHFTKTYAFIKLTEAADHQAAEARHAEFYRRLLRRESTGPESMLADDTVSLPRTDIANIRAAFDWRRETSYPETTSSYTRSAPSPLTSMRFGRDGFDEGAN